MSLKPDFYLGRLAVSGNKNRREALTGIFDEEGIGYETVSYEADKKLGSAVNIIISESFDAGSFPLFTAHYDAHTDSTGANDNAAAISILIALCSELRSRDIPADYAFFDGEETGHSGARHFELSREREYSAVINLDMCGYGDTIAVYTRGSEKKPGARQFCDKKRLESHHARLVKYLPEGDDICFSTRRQPVISIAIMPRWDTRYLDAMAAQGSGLIGRTPEFKMMLSEMEVSSTMHGGFRDDIKWIQPEAMQQVYDYLLDCMISPSADKRGLGFLRR